MEGSRSLKIRGARCRRGSQLVEGTLMILPFLALAFLVIDASWGLFIDATLQYAAHEGVRYAVTGGVSPGLGQIASIQTVVQQQSLGLANSSNTSVSFFSPSNLTTPLTGAGSNAGGNVVEVQVTYQFTPLAPLFRSGAAITLNATSADIMAPGATPPSL